MIEYWLFCRGLLPLVLLCACGASAVHGEQPDGVEEGRKALQSTGDYVWYDDSTDGVRRINTLNRHSDSASFQLADVFRPLVWLGIIILFAGLAFLMIRAFLRRDKRLASVIDTRHQDDEAHRILDRIDDLPVKLNKPTGDLLSAAREHYLAGQYAEAIVYLYSHQLVQLDRRNLIRLTRGKTNRQYLREISSYMGIQQLVEQTMIVFEEVFFGRRSLSRERFECVWNQMDDFQQMIQQAAK